MRNRDRYTAVAEALKAALGLNFTDVHGRRRLSVHSEIKTGLGLFLFHLKVFRRKYKHAMW